jgi:hypothetical protein
MSTAGETEPHVCMWLDDLPSGHPNSLQRNMVGERGSGRARARGGGGGR